MLQQVVSMVTTGILTVNIRYIILPSMFRSRK